MGETFSRVWGSLSAALVTWSFAAAMGVPIWRDGWALSAIGDRTDIAVFTFIACMCFSRKPSTTLAAVPMTGETK